jgi:signal transduction histidine kinase
LPEEAIPYLSVALPVLKTKSNQPVLYAVALVAMARAQAQLHQREAALVSLATARENVEKLHIPRLDIDYHNAAAEVHETVGNHQQANQELRQLVTAEREAARANDKQRLQELQVKFDVDLKDRDNALLRARAAEADSRRLALALGLALSVIVLGGGALLLQLKLRASRSSNDMLATLAQNGREITFGLDEGAVLEALLRQLKEMAGATSASVWLRGEDGRWRTGALPAGGEALPRGDAPATLELVDRCASTRQEIVERWPVPVPTLAGWRRFVPRRRASECVQAFEPLLNGDAVIGVVSMSFAEARRYRNRQRQIVRTTCLYAAVALANIRTARLLSETQVELEQDRTRDMLVHTARLVTVGSMASGIVHEMAHPVGSMMLQSSNAQASLETGEAASANEALSGIHREARRLQNLITRLRNLCRSDPPQVEDIDLLAVLEDAHALFQPQLHMARVGFTQEAPSVRVKVDAERVVLAIANIVSNAMDAMEGRELKRIEIRVTTAEAYARVDIRDTGPGLTPTQLARLFEPFYTTKPSGKGLGLGLALSVKSIESIHGRIEAANHPDGGAVFTLCLPLAAAPEEASVSGSTEDSGLLRA